MSVLSMTELDLAGKHVLIRQDLNVPIQDGVITSDVRIRASLKTILVALEAGATITLMSHLGRPKEGRIDEQYSLAPIAQRLQTLLGEDVALVGNWLEGGLETVGTRIRLCENVRFNHGEKSNDVLLSQRMAKLCDVFVMDAFGSAHRAHASTHGIARYASQVCAGPLLSAELTALSRALENPTRPLLAIVGGAKVSTKLHVLENLADKVDQLIVGGGIANTFIAAANHNVGKSLFEAELIDAARHLSDKLRKRDGTIPIPTDVVVASEFSRSATAIHIPATNVANGQLILDIGPKTTATLVDLIHTAGTIIWNGPIGVFEFPQFSEGTRSIAHAVAESNGFSIAGGGETLAAIEKFGVADDISYISTGGGAFLEFIEGKKLPTVAILEERNC